MAGDAWLSDNDLAVLARLLRLQGDINSGGQAAQAMRTYRYRLLIGVDGEGRRFLVRDPAEPAEPAGLRGDRTTHQKLDNLEAAPCPLPADSGIPFAERWLGCLLAGAVADALGAPIEGERMDAIRERCGPTGLTDYIPARDGLGTITDDTQLTLFTLEGLIRAHAEGRASGAVDVRLALQMAYQRWYHSQGIPWSKARGPRDSTDEPGGWLITNRGLHRRRQLGQTCFFALKGYAQTGEMGTFTEPVNNSKGCGGVMRAAPAALWPADPAVVFELGAVSGALTHSHPSGYLPAGALAVIVHQLLRGAALPAAIAAAHSELSKWDSHEETTTALDAAVELARQGPPTPEKVATLGGGNVGESALAIAVYAALSTPELNSALLVAVNHGGDSDSTGAVCGNIVGALYGVRAIRPDWLDRLEMRDVLETIARDALTEFGPQPPTHPDWYRRYPFSSDTRADTAG